MRFPVSVRSADTEGEAMRNRSRTGMWGAAWAVLAAAAGVVVWAGVAGGVPTPSDAGKAYPFPPGRYVLTGVEDARGGDVLELRDHFTLRPGQYILSGGPNPTDLIVVDDDLEVLSGERKVFIDDDHVRSTENRGKRPATYQGFPIVLVADPKAKLHLRVTDCQETDAIVGELWLHRHDGAKRRLTTGVAQPSAQQLPNVFFDEKFDLSEGFEKPASVPAVKGPVTELPQHPAKLLPRFKGE